MRVLLAYLHDGGNLGGHHRQHLHLNAIELIKTCPGTSLSQPTEHLASHLVVHAITTVKYDDILRQRFAKVLQPQGRLVTIYSYLQQLRAVNGRTPTASKCLGPACSPRCTCHHKTGPQYSPMQLQSVHTKVVERTLTVSVLPVPAGPRGLPPLRVNMAAPSVM